MDRQTVYAGSIPLETDLLNTNKNVMTAIAQLSADLFGTKTVFSGLNCIANTPAAMNVVITPGSVYSLAVRDATPYSSLAADATQILKQGIILTNTVLACPAPITSGQSINYLVSASFLEVDINPVVLPYYNAANPTQAFSGPGGLGTSQNTTRQDTVQITLTAGIAATTGSQTTPATPAGQTPLWVVTVPYGAATVTAANIAAAAQTQPLIPSGGFLANIGERFSSIVPVAISSTLTNAVLGALVNITSTGTTQTLPLASSCPNGTSVCVAYMQASGSATVARNGTDTLAFGQGSSANSITLNPGEAVQFVSNGVNGWVSAGQTLSTGVTPPALDSSTKLVTTAWANAIGPVVGASRNLAMSVVAASATATLTADEIVVETALGGAPFRIGSFNKTINLATTGAGGMDTGSAPASGFVALYAIYNPTSGASAILATNATAATVGNVYGGANMPAGYTASALISVWATNASSQFVLGFQQDRVVWGNNTTVLNSATAQASATNISISAAVPKNAKSAYGYIGLASTSAVQLAMNLYPAVGYSLAQPFVVICGVGLGTNAPFNDLPMPTAQNLAYSSTSGGGTPTFSIVVTGYRF